MFSLVLDVERHRGSPGVIDRLSLAHLEDTLLRLGPKPCGLSSVSLSEGIEVFTRTQTHTLHTQVETSVGSPQRGKGRTILLSEFNKNTKNEIMILLR